MKTAKIVIIGDSMVGKTCIAKRYFDGQDVFNDVEETICAGFFKKVIRLNDGDVELVVWDTAGAERFRSLTPIYFINASAAIIVYSVDNPQSFQALDFFHQMLLDKAPSALKYVVGNKIDLNDNRKIDFSKGQNYADSINAEGFYEVSALTGENIDYLFTQIASNPKLKKEFFQEEEAHLPPDDHKENSHCC